MIRSLVRELRQEFSTFKTRAFFSSWPWTWSERGWWSETSFPDYTWSSREWTERCVDTNSRLIKFGINTNTSFRRCIPTLYIQHEWPMLQLHDVLARLHEIHTWRTTTTPWQLPIISESLGSQILWILEVSCSELTILEFYTYLTLKMALRRVLLSRVLGRWWPTGKNHLAKAIRGSTE